ncbi:MAG: serine/threonine-protein kinase [Actinomycetota bacterium]
MSIDTEARRLGYQLTGAVDRGGTATVHRAVDARGRAVALKVLVPGADEARVDRELDLLRRIDHPGVVTYRETGWLDDGTRYVTSDWIDGVTFHRLLVEQGPLPVDRAVDLFAQLADVLDHVHRAGIVHRDLSPRNVMVSPGDRLTLIDFGLSRGDESATITAAADLSGTPRYLAPEVIEGEPATPRADQYSAALLLYESIAGSWPYPEGGSVATALHHQLHSAPVPLIERDAGVPASLDRAVLRALDKDPGRRFDSVSELVMAAVTDPADERGRGGRGGRSRRSRRRDGDGEPTTGRSTDDRRGRWPVVVGAAAAVVALGLASVALGLVDRPGDDGDTNGGDRVAATADDATDGEATAGSSPADAATDGDGAEGDPAEGDGVDPLVVVTTTSQPGSVSTAPDSTVTAGQLQPNDAYIPTAGGAAELSCNLLPTPGFDGGFSANNYYFDPDNDDRERVVSFGGTDNSPVLQVGEANGYGLYGEIVEILPGRRYVFGGWIEITGQVAEASLDVIWLDAEYAVLAEVESPQLVPGAGPDWLAYTTEPAPALARFAVPKIYKDGSPGVLLADELVFAPADSPCSSVVAPN